MTVKNKTKTDNFNVLVPYDLWTQSGSSPWSHGGPFTRPESWMRRRYRYRSWYADSAWKTVLAANGYLPTRYYYDYQENWQYGYERGEYESGTSKVRVEPQVYDLPSTTNSWKSRVWWDSSLMSQLETEAKLKARARAKDMKVNAAVAFGEGHQTIRMIANTARQLGKAYSAFRKRHFKRAADILGITKPSSREAANRWLEWKYGWGPLLADVKGAGEFVGSLVMQRPPRFAVRSGKTEKVKNYDFPNWTGYMAGTPLTDFTLATKNGWCLHRAEAGLLLELQYRSSALAAQLGFGISDPLLVAWELTPFSFVFDWFIKVGELLETISALQGYKVLDGWTTRLYLYEGQVTCRPNSGYTQVGVLHPPKIQFRELTRNSWSGEVSYTPRVITSPFNTDRIITTASLWRQRTMGDRAGYRGRNPFG